MIEILKIIDSNKEVIAYLNNLESGIVRQVINGEYVLKFTALIEELKTEFLHDENNLIEYNNDYFKVIALEEEHNSDNMLKVYCECEHISYDLIKQTKLTYTQTNRSAIYVMNDLLLNSGFDFIGTDVTTTASIDIQKETDIKSLLYHVATIWQGELKYFRNDIELKQQLGTNRGVDFRFGKNVENLRRLIDRAENTISYEIEVVQGSQFEEFGYYELGDTIRVVDDALNIELDIRITEFEKDLVTNLNSRVILGQPIRDLSTGFNDIFNTVKVISGKVDKVDEVIDEHGNLIASRLTGTLNNAIETVQGQTGYVTFDNRGILIHNQPTEAESTWVMLLSSGGILISNAKDLQGAWIWRTAATGESVSADVITTGTLTAINIDGVTITGSTLISDNGTYRTKIEDGKIVIYDTSNLNKLGAEIGYTNTDDIKINCDIDNDFTVTTYSSDGLRGYLINRLYYGDLKQPLVQTEMCYRGTDINNVDYGEFNIEFLTLSQDNSFNVRRGTKNAVIETEEFGDVTFSAYEMAEVLLGDMGDSEVINNECIINLNEKFLACVNTDLVYQVFLTKYGQGDIWVEQRNATSFIVKGDNIRFGWEAKAKRKSFENIRFGRR